jgi:diguanylate cyclase (GGDEF)-like protein/PAS domain S-box-containing protein
MLKPRVLRADAFQELERFKEGLSGPSYVGPTERQLHEAEAKYRTLVEQIPAIVYTAEFGEQGAWSFVSPQIENILGFPPDEWIADPGLWYRQLHPDDRDRAMQQEAESRRTGAPLASEYRMCARDGRIVWFRDDASMVTDVKGEPLFMQGVMYDISDRKRAEEELAFLAYHDKLTELPNRQMFAELLELALVRARRHDLGVAVLFLDLDDFKLVNDELGHSAGDELLRMVCNRLREASRDTDLVARQGGDEFLVLVADIDPSRAPGSKTDRSVGRIAESVASRLLMALQAPFQLGQTQTYASASVGISVYPDDAPDAETLLKHADSAMYQSKRMGPGGVRVYSKDSLLTPPTTLSLVNRLRKAVEDHQWILYYQPIIDLETGVTESVEALLRWREPAGGLILPGEFIPLAEEMGVIAAIGDWVVDEMARQWRRWRSAGRMIDVSFNLSPRQLWQPNLVRSIMAKLTRERVDPQSVTVEITESAAMSDPDRVQRTLHELHGRGMRLAIDDFGTGHSSLARLKHLPVDILKIDRSFVQDIPQDPDASTMVRAMIQLAVSLGMTPVAEGIETPEQHAFMVDAGCRLGQGFLFSTPVPAAEIQDRYGPDIAVGRHIVTGNGQRAEA